jgi:hypothetical protein
MPKSKSKFYVAPEATLKEFDSLEDASNYLIDQREASSPNLALITGGKKQDFTVSMSVQIKRPKRGPRKKKDEGEASSEAPKRSGRTPAAASA